MFQLPKFFTNFILLFTLFTVIVYPQGHVPLQHSEITLRILPEFSEMTYDDVMNLLDDFETGAIEYKYSREDIEKAIDLVIMLARTGLLPDEDPEELERDIQELLYGEGDFSECSFKEGCSTFPALFYGKGDTVLCKNWFVKSCQKTGKFIKKKRKAIIIGAAVAVAVITVVGIAAAATAGAAAVGAAADNSTSSKSSTSTSSPTASNPTSTLYTQIEVPTISFKENIASEHFFQPSFYKETSQEKGRVLGSLFAHDTLNQFSDRFAVHPNFATNEHDKIDHKFTTDYTQLYSNSKKEPDFNTLAYQLQGERELSSGHLNQAIYDFSQAIERNPTSPLPYLERGVAHFGLGQYDRSLEDYHQFAAQVEKTEPLSIPSFSLGFAKGLPSGICESGKGLALFVSDVALHPVRTGGQVWESLKLLADLTKSQEWSTLSEVLAPEVHQLVKEWDTLDSEVRGQLAGHAFGKYGADILIPGALAKAVAKGAKGAQELSAVYKTLQNAEKALLLESAAELGSSAKIGEALTTTYNTALLGEELGFSVKEMNQLKQAGKLEGAINSSLEKLVSQSESEVYKATINQNKHVKMVRDYLDKPAKEIQKGINSYEKQIAIHKDKIVNPAKYCPDWDKLDPRQREALLNKKWPAEIQV
ncbi:MAG: tetratricopeptide repeat protein [Rhabdochlamydiaceae bacterium]|jgi:tetratricopeptide (TPR) repeat protein